VALAGRVVLEVLEVLAGRVVLAAAGPEEQVVLAGAVLVVLAEQEVVGQAAVLAVSVQAWGPGRLSGPGRKPT
jgi:hypothetical protein